MSATGKPVVWLILPSGTKFTLETNIIPRCGDFVQLGKPTYKVLSVCCVFDAVDGNEDHYSVTLGGL